MHFDKYIIFCGIILSIYIIPSVLYFISASATQRNIKKKKDETIREIHEWHDKYLADMYHWREQYINDIKRVASETSQKYPWLAEQIADLECKNDEEIAHTLSTKARPALKAADEIRSISREKRELLKENKMLKYQLQYLTTVIPWLEEFKEVPPIAGYRYLYDTTQAENEYDSLREWLSPAEYQSLPSAEKYQRALDRYLNRKKSDWDIGIEYERYVGYIYETHGYKVTYNGALKGLEDMGCDLFLEKDDVTYVVQCKRWSSEKVIHEKHIFQLYGATEVKRIQDPNTTCQAVFYTTARVSDLARICAKRLRILVLENKPYQEDYPKIKCNINLQTGEKIYHLPMDQQYDRVQIANKPGAMYVHTVKEAEQLGFRRAHRWRGTDA